MFRLTGGKMSVTLYSNRKVKSCPFNAGHDPNIKWLHAFPWRTGIGRPKSEADNANGRLLVFVSN